MEVNYNVWGAQSTWVDGGTTEQKADIKYADSSYDTYRELYEAGRIELNTIDISPAYWGIGKGSILTKQYYLSPYQRDGETIVAVDPAIDNKVQPLILISGTIGTAQHVRFDMRYSPMRTTSPSASTPYNNKVVLSFDYQKVMIVPYVIYKNPGYTSSTSSGSLYDFITNETYIGKEVIGFGYQFYCGAGGEIQRTKLLTSLASPCSYKGYDLYYNDVSFWANGGCDLLNHNVEIGTSNNTYIGAAHTGTTTDIVNTVGDALTALAYKYSKSASTAVYVYYFDPENTLWKINKTGVRSGLTKWYEYPYIEVTSANVDDFKDYVLEQIAYLGFPFVYNQADVTTKQIGEIGVYLPVFDEYGVTTGEYKEGSAALTLPNSRWIDGREGAGYDPSIIPGNEDFGDLTNQRPGRIINAGGLEMFVMTYAEVESFERFITGTYSPTDLDLIADFKGTNPQDYIVSVQKYPFDLPPKGITGEPIYIGKIDTEKTALAFDDLDQNNCYLDFGTISFITDIVPYYDYRDYDTKIVLLLPFIGSVDLDPRLYFGHNLGVIYNIDYYTGHVTAEIKRDGLTVDTKTNNISITIPFFAGNMGQYQSALAQTQLAIEQSKIKQITGAVTTVASIGGAAASIAGGSMLGGLGSAGGIVKGASNMLLERINQESLEYTLTHTQPNVGSISTAAPGNAFLMDDRARVLVWRPYMLDGYKAAATETRLSGAQLYASTVGCACAIPGYLSDFSGFTVAASAELAQIYTIDGTKAATEQEIQMIRAQLLKGVYI